MKLVHSADFILVDWPESALQTPEVRGQPDAKQRLQREAQGGGWGVSLEVSRQAGQV